MLAGSPFFDTNILFYLLQEDTAKAEKAESLLREGGIISVQVLNEFVTAARRKAKRDWPAIYEILTSIRTACRVVPLTAEIHDKGLKIAERYGFSIYDSMIIAAASSHGCNILYSEDLQDGQIIGHTRVSNPF